MFNAFDVSLIAPIAGTVVADVDKPVIKGVKYGIQDIPSHHATHEIVVFIDAVDLQDYFGPDGLGYQTIGSEIILQAAFTMAPSVSFSAFSVKPMG